MATIRQGAGKVILGVTAIAQAVVGTSLIINGDLLRHAPMMRLGVVLLIISSMAAIGWVLLNCLSFNDQFEAGYTVGYERGCADTSKKHVVRPYLIKGESK